jgi:AcrR family transcriptional regulator
MFEVHVKKNLSCCEAEDGAPRKTASQRVFETARELFYRRGIRAVGIDEIVAEAGVTKPSLYRAFASKDALVAACLEESAKEGRIELDAIMARTPDDPHQQLRGIVRHYGEKMTRPGFRGCPMSNTAVEFPEAGHLGRTVLEACKGSMHERLAEITRRLPIDDPDALADGIMLIIEGAMASYHIFGSQGPSASLMGTADALIDSYLKAKAA